MNASSTTAEEKARLRRQVRAQLSDLSPEELRESDQALFEAFLALPQVEEARSLFLFWGIPGREPETEILVRTLTARGKRVGLPRMLPERGMEVRLFQPEVPMAQVSFGIWEPPDTAWALAGGTTTGGCPGSKDLLWACAGSVSSSRKCPGRPTTSGWTFC